MRRRGIRLTAALLSLAAAGYAAACAGATIRVAVISDLNGSYGSLGYHDAVETAIEQIIELQPDLVISTGDMIAGQSSFGVSAEHLQAMWAAFHRTVTEPLAAAGIPFAITPGNHDGSAYARFAEERVEYDRQWRGRGSALQLRDGDGYPFDYTFELGGDLYVSLDVTVAGKLREHRIDWLRAALTDSEERYRRVIVFSHVPVWPFAIGRQTEASMDTELHRLLVEAGADLYLSGHHHAFYPGFVDGISYVAQACLGSGARHLIGDAGGPRYRGFTLLELTDEAIHVASLPAPEFSAPVDWNTLPGHIEFGDVYMLRADIAGSGVQPFPRGTKW